MRALLGLLALFVTILPSAQAAEVQLEAHLSPAEPLELALQLEAGAEVEYAYATPAVVRFEVVSPGGASQSIPNATGRFHATALGAHQFRWTNTGSEWAVLDLRLTGDFEYVTSRGLHQLPPTLYAPLPGAVLLLTAWAWAAWRRRA